MSTRASEYRKVLKERFGGKLKFGKHNPNGEACALEVASIVRGHAWTDNPTTAGLPDLRPLNDGPWSSDTVRTKALVPVIEALWSWPGWMNKQRQSFAKEVAARIIGEVLPIALRAISLIAEADRCEQERSAESAARSARSAARSAAWSARSAESAAWSAESAARSARSAARSAGSAAWSAESAAWSARSAARSAGSASADKVLILACRIWKEEAEKITA